MDDSGISSLIKDFNISRLEDISIDCGICINESISASISQLSPTICPDIFANKTVAPPCTPPRRHPETALREQTQQQNTSILTQPKRVRPLRILSSASEEEPAAKRASKGNPDDDSPPSPPRKKQPLRISHKCGFEFDVRTNRVEDPPVDSYLVEWETEGEVEQETKTTWEWADQLPEEIVAEFESRLANDPKLANILTQYEVETLLDRTVDEQPRKYLVRWVGWRLPSWEDERCLLPSLNDLVGQFERMNGGTRQMDENNEMDGEGGTKLKFQPVVQAVEVLHKVLRGDKPPKYLVRWPPGTGMRCPLEKAELSMEQHKSLGNRRAIEHFERQLEAKGSTSKKRRRQLVQYEVERLVSFDERMRTFEVKWAGYKKTTRVGLQELLPTCSHLVEQFAFGSLKKGRPIEGLPLEGIRRALPAVDAKAENAFKRLGDSLNKVGV